MTAQTSGDPKETYRYPKPEALLRIPKDRPTVIEASAGTGKTYTIEHLILDLLLTTDAGIENILVVTFTEKATTELISRVRKKIRELVELREDKASVLDARPDDAYWHVDENARRRLRKALTSFERAPISTIHSFCHTVLTEYAFLNRRLFEQSQVEEQCMFSQVFKEVLRSELSRNEAYRPYLTAWLETGKSIDALEKLLFEAQKAASPLVPPFEPERIESAIERLLETPFDEETVVAELRDHGVAANSAKAVAKRLPKLQQTAEAYKENDLPTALAHMSEIECDYILDRIYKAAATDGVLAKLQAAVEALKAATVPFDSALAQSFLPPIRERLNASKREKGLYDFNDMITVVAESLEGPLGDELVHALRSRYHYALIDEFQDTDAMQWRIFRKIFFESDGKNPLFAIGDPKQAIYAFRGADVHVYLDARETVRKAEGRVIPLTGCYRATPALIEAHNWILKQEGDAPFFTGDITYDYPVEAGKPKLRLKKADGAEAPPVTLFQFEWPAGKVNLSDAKKALRARIAREIQSLLRKETALTITEGDKETPITAGEIFVLTRSGRDGYEVGATLKQFGIPYVYYKQDGLFQTPEAQDIRALLAAIEDPADPSKRFHAWITPFFGLKLADLLGCRDVPAEHPLMERLLEWKALIEAKAYEKAFTSMLEDSGILRRALFLKENERALTNYQHIFEILLEEMGRTRCTLPELIRTLQAFIDQRGLPAGESTNFQRLESDREAVHIMTMHMAKGLEAGVVFLYGGFAQSPAHDKVHIFYENGKRAAFAGSLKKASQAIERAIRREEQREYQRLLYVAMTRAKARLYLPYFPEKIYVDRKGKEQSREILRSRSCYEPLNSRLRFLLDQAAPGEKEREDVVQAMPVENGFEAAPEINGYDVAPDADQAVPADDEAWPAPGETEWDAPPGDLENGDLALSGDLEPDEYVVSGDLEFGGYILPDEDGPDIAPADYGPDDTPAVDQAPPEEGESDAGSADVVQAPLGELETLLHIEKIPVGLPPDDALRLYPAPDLFAWRPAPVLVLAEDTDATFRQLVQNHAGFVITSYSRMKSLRGGYRAPIDTGADLTDEPEGAEAPETTRDALPGGSAAGVFLHEVLEAIDFETLNRSEDFETWAANEDVRKLFRKMLRRHAFPDRYLTHSQKLVHTTLTTPLQLHGGRPICFHELKRDMREVEFVYPYPESHHPSIAEGIEHPFRIERGYVKGFVDFVFEHRGLTYFADWKSDSLPTWDTEALNDHVQRNYKLQAQLYSLALIKMLGIRTEAYFKARFGGLLYIFLRGLNAEGDRTSGVYFEEPTWSQILNWEQELVWKTRL